jgi:mono/diheme cytochrome c family protein
MLGRCEIAASERAGIPTSVSPGRSVRRFSATISFSAAVNPCIDSGMTPKTPACLLALCAVGILMGCSTPPRPAGAADGSAFAEARTVIERNCVHCHGTQRLKMMPSFNDTLSLAALRGPGNWIVPFKPEESRFFQVVTMPGSQRGAMPPTGHGISTEEIGALRAWIVAGAPLPDGAPVMLTPQGPGPRSL